MSSDCKKYTEDFSAYLDGEVVPSRAKEIRTHVENCPECAEEFYTLEESVQFLQSHMRKIEPRPASWATLESRLGAAGGLSSQPGLLRFFFSLRTALVTAALAVGFLIFGLWGYKQLQTDDRDIELYMNAYIKQRDLQESIHRRISSKRPIAIRESTSPVINNAEYGENPFVSNEPATQENPFRMEGQ